MPIDNIPVRLRELGRLKFGEDLGDRPVQLTTWRLTSPNPVLIDAAAVLWGGTPEAVDRANGETWEVVTETGELDVLVPPQDVAAGQWWEQWTAGGLQRRCSGSALVEHDPDEPTGWRKVAPCICDEENGPRVCKPTTVLRVLLPQLPDLGVWRLTTRSALAAGELPPAVDFLLQRSSLAAAVLGLDSRSSKAAGGPRHDFVVPVLRTRSTLLELSQLPAAQGVQQLPFDAGQAPEVPPELTAGLPAPESGPDILPGGPQNPPQGAPQTPGPSQGASGDTFRHIDEPKRSARRQALVDFLAEIDPGDLPHAGDDLVTLLANLEGLATAADVWEPGALDRAAEKWLDGPGPWRTAHAYQLRTFAQRAVLALGKENL